MRKKTIPHRPATDIELRPGCTLTHFRRRGQRGRSLAGGRCARAPRCALHVHAHDAHHPWPSCPIYIDVCGSLRPHGEAYDVGLGLGAPPRAPWPPRVWSPNSFGAMRLLACFFHAFDRLDVFSGFPDWALYTGFGIFVWSSFSSSFLFTRTCPLSISDFFYFYLKSSGFAFGPRLGDGSFCFISRSMFSFLEFWSFFVLFSFDFSQLMTFGCLILSQVSEYSFNTSLTLRKPPISRIWFETITYLMTSNRLWFLLLGVSKPYESGVRKKKDGFYLNSTLGNVPDKDNVGLVYAQRVL